MAINSLNFNRHDHLSNVFIYNIDLFGLKLQGRACLRLSDFSLSEVEHFAVFRNFIARLRMEYSDVVFVEIQHQNNFPIKLLK